VTTEPVPSEVARTIRTGLTHRANAALGVAVLLTGDREADIVNRAIEVHALLAEVSVHTTPYYVEVPEFDRLGPLYLVASRTPIRPRRWRLW